MRANAGGDVLNKSKKNAVDSSGPTSKNKEQDQSNSFAWLAKTPKIDCHTHIDVDSAEEELFEMLESQNMKWLTVCYDGLQWPELEKRIKVAEKFHAEYPERVSWATSFKLTNWGSPEWAAEAIDLIGEGFEHGAVAVKVWKDIGMALRDSNENFVMIDDPRFDPVFDFIRQQDKTLVGHVIEPRNCWLPLESMAVKNDREYYRDHPEEHACHNPEIAQYSKYLDTMKRLLKNHPHLRIVVCHLAGLESDIDALAELYDTYSNFAVDTAARIGHLQYLDRDKVRAFLIKYQDRLLYGTDLEIARDDAAENREHIHQATQTYERDRLYFSADQEITVPELDRPLRGLALPTQVLQKIYFTNAQRWYPGI